MNQEGQIRLSKTDIPVRTKAEAQDRVDQIQAFRQELTLLEQEQVLVLTHEQQTGVARYQQQILHYLASVFDTAGTTKEKQLGLGLAITASSGTLALAASVFFFYFQFWGGLPTTTQVQIVTGAPVIGLLCAAVAAMTGRFPSLARLFTVITWLCFVLNVLLLGRIYNCFPSAATVLAYAALAFVLAYAVTSRLLLVAGIMSLSAFLAAQMTIWKGWYWLSFYEHPEYFFAAALLFFLLSLIPHRLFTGFSSLYRICALLLFFLPVLLLSNWGEISNLERSVEQIETIYLLIGFIGSGLLIALGILLRWPEVVHTSYVFFTLFLFIQCYNWWWEWMSPYQFFLVVGVVAVLMFIGLKFLRYYLFQRNLQRLLCA